MRNACLAIAAWVGFIGPELADPPTKLRVVSPRKIGVIATGLNNRGDLVGFEWVEEKERPGVVEQKPFFAKGKEVTYLPTLKGFTATFPAAVSDDGLVVGRASKPAPPGVQVGRRNQAFVWDTVAGIRGLDTLPGDSASFASGVSRDGRRISGYSVGPNRIRGCVWDREGDAWVPTRLPGTDHMTSTVVPISGNGRVVAGAIEGRPCLWTQDANGWKTQLIGEIGEFVPRAVNDGGTVAGIAFPIDQPPKAVVWTRERGSLPVTLPKGYTRSEALAVNNFGLVVGMIDGTGDEVQPRAFAFENGGLRVIDDAGPVFSSATAVNDVGEVSGVLEEVEVEVKEPPASKAPQ